ncbi:hypothetical protein F8N00_11935 [Exiguobacterium sp. A1_3_1]|uniref:copper resistance CopC family protein n=1 Tax=Exiguobacterium sp. A1_3_1 TaxID=2651871 RepID=UPI003B8897A7
MTKIRVLLLGILVGAFFYYPNNAFAHTGLESSNPAANQTVESTQTVELNFATKIEAGGTLRVYQADDSTPLQGTVSQENQNLKLESDRPLTPGSYRVDWKIVGTDGHPIEDTYTFVVASKKQESASAKDTTADSQKKEDGKQEATFENETARTADDGESSSFLIAGILLILVVYFFYRIVLKGRKR